MRDRYLFLSMTVLLLAACSREELDVDDPAALRAELEASVTRVSVAGPESPSPGKMAWTPGDRIAVHVGNAYVSAAVEASSGYVQGLSEAARNRRNHFAVYPFLGNGSNIDSGHFTEDDLNVILPASYDITDIVSGAEGNPGEDFSPVPMVAVNQAGTSLLRFRHVGGLLRVVCNNVSAGVRSIRVTVDGGITGSFAVSDPATDAPSITAAEATSANNSVVFTIAGGSGLVSETSGLVLNVPVPCGTYSDFVVGVYGTADASGDPLATVTVTGQSHTFSRSHAWQLPVSSLTVTYHLDDLSDVTTSYTGGLAPGTTPYIGTSFKSYKLLGDVPVRLPFHLEYSASGEDGTWSCSDPGCPNHVVGESCPPWILRVFSDSDFAGSVSGEYVRVVLDQQKTSPPDYSVVGSHAYYLYNATPPSGTRPFDLSTLNVATGETVQRSTANCYVVQAPGWYKFPLVYGNGVLNGQLNPDAYRAREGVGGPYRPDDGVDGLSDTYTYFDDYNTYGYLGSFKDHLGNNIHDSSNPARSSPYLAVHLGTDAFTPVLLWSDVEGAERDTPGLITNLGIIGSGEDACVVFNVPKEGIDQGNALIGVLVDGKIAWSWHIWVTDEDLTATKAGCNNYAFAPVNVGWCDAKTDVYAPRSCYVRAVQAESGLASNAALVTQNGKEIPYNGNSPYYQWGRKDPLGAWGSDDIDRKKYYTLESRYRQNFTYERSFPIERSIQTPSIFLRPYDDYKGWCQSCYHNAWDASNTGHLPVYDMTDGYWNDEPYTWLDDSSSDHALLHAPVTKTIYDPSPVGYKVPPLAAWEDFGDSGKMNWTEVNGETGVRYESSGLFFPSIGCRLSRYYDVSGAGGKAFYWSTALMDIGALALYADQATGTLSVLDTSVHDWEGYEFYPGEGESSLCSFSCGLPVRPVVDEASLYWGVSTGGINSRSYEFNDITKWR